MQLTIEQVIEMAPDGSSAAAGKKLIAAKNWQQLGTNPDALWGLCQGSSVYQVKVDRSNLGYHCSCPSRKFPCKHVLGLLMLYAVSPAAVTESPAPEWVVQWLQRRQEQQAKKAERQEASAAGAKKPVDERAQQRRAEQRESRVSDGLARLDIWLGDLVRNGLAAVETRPASFWDEQAKRLVDAQAQGIASRVARLGTLPRSSPDWPRRMLAELGRLKLLIHAWQRIGQLDVDLQNDVRQLLGWTVQQDELLQCGEKVSDTWVVFGQWIDEQDRVRAERSWVVGRQTHRTGLLLQFAPGAQPFAESIVAGSEQEGTVVFYPGTARQRARFVAREGHVRAVTTRPPGAGTIDEFLASVAQHVARVPWLPAFGAMLHDVTLVLAHEQWFIRDRHGHALPLRGRDHYKMLAITGAHSFDLAGEWDGDRLLPLGLLMDGKYRVI